MRDIMEMGGELAGHLMEATLKLHSIGLKDPREEGAIFGMTTTDAL
jgi:hypothetical protein